jgi:hypothetical protein
MRSHTVMVASLRFALQRLASKSDQRPIVTTPSHGTTPQVLRAASINVSRAATPTLQNQHMRQRLGAFDTVTQRPEAAVRFRVWNLNTNTPHTYTAVHAGQSTPVCRHYPSHAATAVRKEGGFFRSNCSHHRRQYASRRAGSKPHSNRVDMMVSGTVPRKQ